MTEDPFSNREITEMFKDITNGLTRVEAQTTKTNGRVNDMEKWRAFMTGAMAVLTTLVVPILAWSIYTLVNIQHTIHQTVDEALSAYNIKPDESN